MAAGVVLQTVLLEKHLYIGVTAFPLNDEMLITHFVQGNEAGLPVGKVRWNDAHQRIHIPPVNGQLTGAGGGKKSQLRKAVFDPVDHIVIASLIDIDPDFWISLLKPAEDFRHPVCADTVENPQVHGSAAQTPKIIHSLIQGILAAQKLQNSRVQRTPVFGQSHAGFCAVKQLEPHLAFGVVHRMADGGGGHIQAFRRFQKASLCDNAAEDTAKGKCHMCSF